jgi:hypothetical protein
MCTACALHAHCMRTACAQHVHCTNVNPNPNPSRSPNQASFYLRELARVHSQAGEWAASRAALAQALPLFGLLAPPDITPDTSVSRYPCPHEASSSELCFELALEASGASLDRELSPELSHELSPELSPELSQEILPELHLGQISAMAAAAARGWPVCLEIVISNLVDAGGHLVRVRVRSLGLGLGQPNPTP